MTILRKIMEKGPGWVIRKSWHRLRTSSNPLWKIFLVGMPSSARSEEGSEAPLLGFYDLNANSPSYNFVQFLMCIENHVVKRKISGYTVVIVPKELPEDLEWKSFIDSYGPEAIDYRSVHLLSQLAMLGEHCRGVIALPDRALRKKLIQCGRTFPRDYGFYLGGGFDRILHKDLTINGIKRDFRVPAHIVKIVDEWFARRSKKRIVSITLRNSPFDPIRNSNVPEWIRFARFLEENGFHPVLIPDTDAAFSSADGFDPEALGSAAAFSPAVRLAVYQRCFVNFFVPNGPYGFALYSTGIRYICMKLWLSGSVVAPASPEQYDYLDPETHNPYWASWGQWHTGEMDTYDNLVAIFAKFVEEAEKHLESVPR